MEGVFFGKWPREIDGISVPIEWLVVDEAGQARLLLAKETLEVKSFTGDLPNGRKHEPPSWGYSDLRYWLNTTFLRYAFSEEERRHIVKTNFGPQAYSDNRSSATSTLVDVVAAASAVQESRDMLDYVFCLSADEAQRYLGDGELRTVSPNPFVSGTIGKSRAAKWWLRDSDAAGMHYVDSDGSMSARKWPAGAQGVRPAFWLCEGRAADEVVWNSETPGNDETVLNDVLLGEADKHDCGTSGWNDEWVQGDNDALVTAVKYGDLPIAKKLLSEGKHIPTWGTCFQEIMMEHVGCQALSELMRGGLVDVNEYAGCIDVALNWKRYSFVAEFFPDVASENWSKIKTSPRAVKLLAPSLDASAFKSKAALAVKLAENGFVDELELLIDRGGFFTKANLAKACAAAGAAGQVDAASFLEAQLE